MSNTVPKCLRNHMWEKRRQEVKDEVGGEQQMEEEEGDKKRWKTGRDRGCAYSSGLKKDTASLHD